MLHEKLTCYRLAVEVATHLGRHASSWPRGYGYLADQLKRAMASVVLNLAEGNGRAAPRERRRFFGISRGSVAEVSACVDLMSAFMLISEKQADEFKARLDRISKMLYRLN